MIGNNESLVLFRMLTENNLIDSMIVASVGGVVNYFIHSELLENVKGKLSYFSKHVFISMFTGFIVGLICIDFPTSITQTLLLAAIAGTSGSEVIVVLQKKVSGWLESKQI